MEFIIAVTILAVVVLARLPYRRRAKNGKSSWMKKVRDGGVVKWILWIFLFAFLLTFLFALYNNVPDSWKMWLSEIWYRSALLIFGLIALLYFVVQQIRNKDSKIDSAIYNRVGLVFILWIVFNGLLFAILPEVMEWWQGKGTGFFLGTEIAIMVLFYLMIAFKDMEDKNKPGIKVMQRIIVGLLVVGFLAPPVIDWLNKPSDPPKVEDAIEDTTPKAPLQYKPMTGIFDGVRGLGKAMTDGINGVAKTKTQRTIRKLVEVHYGEVVYVSAVGVKTFNVDTMEGKIRVTRPDGIAFYDYPGKKSVPLPVININKFDVEPVYTIKSVTKVARLWLEVVYY